MKDACGSRSAAPPSSMNTAPMAGTALTENAPPVITAAPYSTSQLPAISSARGALPRYNTTVRTAAAIIGGTKLAANLRPGAENSGMPARCALRRIVHNAIPRATAASASHTDNHRGEPGMARNTTHIVDVARAVTPIATMPHPGTAVNDAALSMVRRIKRRSSRAAEPSPASTGIISSCVPAETVSRRRIRCRGVVGIFRLDYIATARVVSSTL